MYVLLLVSVIMGGTFGWCMYDRKSLTTVHSGGSV